MAANTIAAAHARADRRDVEIVRIGRRIDEVTARFAREVAGLLAIDGDKFPWVLSRTDALLRRFPEALARAMEAGLSDLALWSHARAAEETVARLPIGVWLVRSLQPFGEFPRRVKTREKRIDPPGGNGRDRRPPDKKRTAYARMLKLQSPAEQRKTIAQWELPPPDRATVRRLIDATSARDGLSAMERVKTVSGADLDRLRRDIIGELSRPFEDGRASAIKALTDRVSRFFDEEEGWKAKRIARTEGIRISEQVRREADEAVADIYTARRWLRRGAQPCEICDPLDRVVYTRDESGQYVSDAGELLPDLPAHPNCVCFTVPELRPDIEQNLPPRNLGAWYARATADPAAMADYQYAAAGT